MPVLSLLGGLNSVAMPATAGPPFQTDDPEPVPYQHFEFYTFSIGTAVRGDTQGEAPAWEFNHLLVSFATGLQNASDTNLFSWYLGYQITGP